MSQQSDQLSEYRKLQKERFIKQRPLKYDTLNENELNINSEAEAINEQITAYEYLISSYYRKLSDENTDFDKIIRLEINDCESKITNLRKKLQKILESSIN